MKQFRTTQEMKSWVRNLAVTTKGRAAVIAGHFTLNEEGMPETAVDGAFGIFPKFTMEIGCSIVKEAKGLGKDVKLMILVDDHSIMPNKSWWMPSFREDPLCEEIRANVEKFFASSRIPENLREIMERFDLSEEDVFWANDRCIAFQESRFREIFSKENEGMPIGCAGEVSIILRDLAQRGVTRVIGFIPIRCQGPICSSMNMFNIFRKNSEDIRGVDISFAFFETDSSISTVEDLQKSIAEIGGIPFIRNKTENE